MNGAGVGSKRVSRTTLVFMAVVLGMAMSGYVFLLDKSANAQEQTSASQEPLSVEVPETEANGPDNSGQLKPIPEAEGSATTQRAAVPKAPGPLAGTEVESESTDGDAFVERFIIPLPGICEVQDGASLVLQDDDGTQGTFIEGENVQIRVNAGEIIVKSSPPNDTNANNNITVLNPRGGDDSDGQMLDGSGLTVATTTDITCEDDGNTQEPPPEDPTTSPVVEPPDQDEDPTAPVDPAPTDEETTGDGQLDEEQQDAEVGPLAGGTAKGLDVLDPGDEECGPEEDPTRFVCIDQIVIETENCEIIEGEEVSVTLEDSGGLVRIRDGVNVDFELEEDGTLRADGRADVAGIDNPRFAIIFIPVNPENYEPNDQVPEDTFPVVSSTGIGGEGCKAVLAEETTPDNTTTNSSDGGNSSDDESSVIDGTYDPNKTLANTGGETAGMLESGPVGTMLVSAGSLLVVASMGLGFWLSGRPARRE